MRDVKKYCLVKRELWIAKKQGCHNGYGVTPKAAHADAIKRAQKQRNERITQERLCDHVRKTTFREKQLLINEIGMLKNENASLRGKLSSLVKDKEWERAEGWVMMACAFFGTLDTRQAIAQAKARGVKVNLKEVEAALRVNEYIQRWKDALQ